MRESLEIGIWSLEIGIWRLEFGVPMAIGRRLEIGIVYCEFRILNFEFRILNFEFRIIHSELLLELCLLLHKQTQKEYDQEKYE